MKTKYRGAIYDWESYMASQLADASFSGLAPEEEDYSEEYETEEEGARYYFELNNPPATLLNKIGVAHA